MIWYMLLAWVISFPISFYVRTVNHSVITVGDVWWMIIFGPLNLAVGLFDINIVVWRREEKK